MTQRQFFKPNKALNSDKVKKQIQALSGEFTEALSKATFGESAIIQVPTKEMTDEQQKRLSYQLWNIVKEKEGFIFTDTESQDICFGLSNAPKTKELFKLIRRSALQNKFPSLQALCSEFREQFSEATINETGSTIYFPISQLSKEDQSKLEDKLIALLKNEDGFSVINSYDEQNLELYYSKPAIIKQIMDTAQEFHQEILRETIDNSLLGHPKEINNLISDYVFSPKMK